jgi:hypothetical protein
MFAPKPEQYQLPFRVQPGQWNETHFSPPKSWPQWYSYKLNSNENPKIAFPERRSPVLQAAVRLVLAVFAVCAASRADVIYDFSGTVAIFGYVEMFRYTSPAFISADTFVPASVLDSCSTGQSLPCFGVNFLPSGPDTSQHYPELTFQSRTTPCRLLSTTFH